MGVRDLVAIALFAAFIIALGVVPAVMLPVLAGVPVTMQGIGFMLSGALLGARRAFLCAIVIWVLVAVGLPVLAGGRGGIAVFAGPTVGYLFGNGFGAALIGFLFEKMRHKLTPVKIVLFLALGGIGVTYSMGILWLYMMMDGIGGLATIIYANLIFLPGDGLKIAVCYFIIRVVHKSLPEFLRLGK